MGIDTCNKTFLCLEVEGHRVALILIATHLEDWRSHQLMGGRVHLTRGMHEVTVKTHVDLLTLEVHVLVLHVRLTIEVCQTRGGIIGQRVVGHIFHRRVDTILTTAVDAVLGQRVVHGLIMLIDSQFDGVHRRGVALDLGGSISSDEGIHDHRFGHNTIVCLHSPHGFGDKLHRYFRHHKKYDEQHQDDGRFSFHAAKVQQNRGITKFPFYFFTFLPFFIDTSYRACSRSA